MLYPVVDLPATRVSAGERPQPAVHPHFLLDKDAVRSYRSFEIMKVGNQR